MSAVILGLWVGWLAGCASPPPRTTPVNLSEAKASVVAYVDSGAYERELAAVAADARAWLERRAARRASGERLAVVFDLDETVLSNYAHMRAQDFGYVSAVWTAWVDEGRAPVLAPVRTVYDTARRLGIDVIFLTGREEPRDRPGTEANLRREGLGEYARLILAAPDDPAPTAAASKAAARAALEREGWTIVASIGDQESDLAGGHAERVFKLPNPFYAIP